MEKILVVLLTVIPFVAQLLVIPWVNHIYPIIIGFPFLHFWLLIWMILTPVCTYGVYLIQKSKGGFEE
ncbi:DUF3311 domain-containing protein [Bacillus sp. ISL-7]|uniref:DUF3311 domain-containing protein n=1 Tax=Bacillus sp. ISL-7 TaxID=2819136 RepID=UPI001BE8DF2B|nr:DUF3311 domain-containing protein [Bacillus sp. ISL-7]MBT2737673.1 DUF3311 domain-containing protein [Bacillus sp. ISL-7]